jgi:hypothetical protein
MPLMANVSFSFNPVPAPACYPSDVNSLAQMLTNGGVLAGTVPDNAGGGVFVGSSPPSSALTNKVWFKTDAAGRPLGVFMFYNGNWRKVYTGIGYGELRMYIGSNTVFDGTGRGVIGGDFDGWQLCNGQNGAPNLEAYFAVGGQWGTATDGSGDTGWVTDTDGLYWRNHGGAKRNQIAAANLPALHVSAWAYALRPAYSSGTPGLLLSNAPPQAGVEQVGTWPVIETQGSPNSDLPKPLFFAVAYMMFIGYQ